MHGTHHSQQVFRRFISVNYHITRLIHTLQLISCNPIFRIHREVTLNLKYYRESTCENFRLHCSHYLHALWCPVGCSISGSVSCFQMQIELGEYLSQERSYIVKTQGSLQVLINPPSPKHQGATFLLPEGQIFLAIYVYY